jgi:outer membrane biosynthesis protein TonB
LTLALHALAFISLHLDRHWMPAPPRPATPEPIQLTFVGQPPAPAAPKTPTYFTELPADREDKAPEHAQFLSNVTSRARDRIAGGDQLLPRTSGVADEPSVELDPGHVDPKPVTPPSEQKAQPPPATAGSAALAAPNGAATGATTPTTTPSTASSTPTIPNPSTASGNSDTRQEAMDNPGGNAELTGDVSLNTTAWNWAPWIERFGRKLKTVWYAPPAYYMGLMKDGGWTVTEMEIARSGKVLRMNVLEQQGHPSLTLAATNALRSMAPVEPLPSDFPENTLVLRIRLFYPKVRSRTP